MAGQGIGAGVVARDIGVVELAVEFEQAQGVAQLPGFVQLVVQARAQRLGAVVNVVAMVAVGGAAADVCRAAVDTRDAAVWCAVVAAVFILHQPVQVGGDLPADRRGEQLAAAVDTIAKAVVVLVAHVQAQADRVAGVGAEVGIQAAQVFAAGLRFDGRAATRLWCLADPVDDAALAATAIQYRCRPLQHFDPLDVVQVADVLAVVANTVQIEVVAGLEAADAYAVKTGVGAAADVGDTLQRLAQRVAAVIQHIGGFHRIDGLRHITHGRRGAGCGAHLLDPRVVLLALAVGGNRRLRQCGGGGAGQAGAEQQRQAERQG
ncbi:hypothetical protein D3C76_957990 [compost metagenome]